MDVRKTSAKLEALMLQVIFYPIDLLAAERCGLLRASLHSRGARIRTRSLDLITAAVALKHGLILVTRNVDDFDDVPGLVLYTDKRLRP